MKKITLAATLMLISNWAWTADLEEGLEAYKIGDYENAFSVWSPLAEQGDAEAQYNLGVMYKNGQGVKEDLKKAVKWYQLSAEQGYAAGQTNLGYMYANGEGVAKDEDEAVRWYSLAAEQGNTNAQYNLSVIEGDITPSTKPDEQKADKPIASPSAEGRLLLSCSGEAIGMVTRSVRSVTNGFARSSGRGSYSGTAGGDMVQGTINGNSNTQLSSETTTSVREEKKEDATVLIDVAEDGWIQIPTRMLPTLQKGFPKKDNKWPFKTFSMTEEQISGKFIFNWLNRPKFTISRITGAIDMNIFGGTFTGQCQKLDRQKRAF